jgi:hypothetical protein
MRNTGVPERGKPKWTWGIKLIYEEWYLLAFDTVLWWKLSDVSEEHTASVFRIE